MPAEIGLLKDAGTLVEDQALGHNQEPLITESAEPAKQGSGWSDLAVRAVSGVVLAVLAFAATWWGGLPFSLLFGLGALLIYREWVAIVGEAPFGIPAVIGYLCVAGSLVCLYVGAWQASLIIPLIGAGFLFFARCSYPYARWCASGILYAAAFGFSAIALRLDEANGFAAIIILFAIVWGTDVAAYFVGKSLGGPKLWPRVSPKKTWSGSVGGLVVGVAFATLVAFVLDVKLSLFLVLMLAFLSILSQLGDLAESHMKRLFNVKDSGTLIPGHGGVMDRVDGLVFAMVAAAVIGFAAGRFGSLATDFLIW
ncbi:phosphatidate cytidylyltransferase [uncultured Cohaesibacter sp.]|uniref:phosphatidate cytidylyltransferase n=1 Tax=uncultured Cohaesibacter sp. TaxID=1002546 RepID=UPI0029C9025E|nr:phosphatidate cytidylyltransferase [uncultured Cohaesibacter sp.]